MRLSLFSSLSMSALWAGACMAPETGSYSTQGIVAGDHPRTHKSVTLVSGAGALVEGTVLGQITEGARTAVGAAGVPAPVAATISAAPVATTAAAVGVHRFVCCVAGATGKFNHFNPAGEFVGLATTGTEYVGGGLTLTITDAGTDPALGETFIVTVTAAAASKKWKKSLLAAIDGSQTPKAILACDADATSADLAAPAFVEGEFAAETLTYGTGHTAVTVEQAFRDASAPLYLRGIGDAA